MGAARTAARASPGRSCTSRTAPRPARFRDVQVGRRVTPRRRLALAERALRPRDGEAQVTVTRERSLLSRFARSRADPGDGASTTSRVDVLVPARRPHRRRRDEPDARRRRAARGRDARRTPRPRAAAASGQRRPPGAATSPRAPTPATTAGTRRPRRSIPRSPARRSARAFAVAAEHGFEAFGIWTAGEVETAIASSTGLRARDLVTDAYMKVICRDAAGRVGLGRRPAAAP